MAANHAGQRRGAVGSMSCRNRTNDALSGGILIRRVSALRAIRTQKRLRSLPLLALKHPTASGCTSHQRMDGEFHLFSETVCGRVFRSAPPLSSSQCWTPPSRPIFWLTSTRLTREAFSATLRERRGRRRVLFPRHLGRGCGCVEICWVLQAPQGHSFLLGYQLPEQSSPHHAPRRAGELTELETALYGGLQENEGQRLWP